MWGFSVPQWPYQSGLLPCSNYSQFFRPPSGVIMSAGQGAHAHEDPTGAIFNFRVALQANSCKSNGAASALT